MAIKNTAQAMLNNSPYLMKWQKQMLWAMSKATEQYKWLPTYMVSNILNATKDMDEDEKKATRNELYRAALPIAQNNDKLDERDKLLNDKAYEISQMQNWQEKNMQITAFKLEDLAQKIKRTYSDQISADADDYEVLNEFLWQIDNAQVLLENYINNWDKELLYEWWLTERPEPKEPIQETFGQKAADFGVWVLQSPWKFGYNIIWQWIDRAAKAVSDKLEWSALQKRVTQAAIDMFWEDEVNAYVEQRNRELENWTAFNGREATDIRTPLLWEERANSKATKAWEIVWDIASSIALTAPLAAATAPMYATATPLWAWLLWATEWTIGTAAAKYWSEWKMASGKELATWAVLWAWAWLLSRWTSQLATKAKDSLKKEVTPYIEKSIKPTVKWKQSQAAYDKFIDDTIDSMEAMVKNKDLIQYTDDAWNVIKWELPTSMRETSEAIQSLKKAVWDNVDDIMKQAWDKGAKVNLSKVYQQLDDIAADQAQNLANPNTKAIVERYKMALLENTDDAWNISIDVAQKLTQDYNKKLTAFFKNQNFNDVSEASIIAKINQWVKNAINDWLDDALDSAIRWWSKASSEYTALKQLYGKLLTIEDEVSKRALVAARQNSKWLSQTVLDAFAWWDIAEALLTMNASKLARWTTMKIIWSIYKYLNSVDRNLSKAFTTVEKSLTEPSKLSQVWTAIKNTAWNIINKTVTPSTVSTAKEILDND